MLPLGLTKSFYLGVKVNSTAHTDTKDAELEILDFVTGNLDLTKATKRGPSS